MQENKDLHKVLKNRFKTPKNVKVEEADDSEDLDEKLDYNFYFFSFSIVCYLILCCLSSNSLPFKKNEYKTPKTTNTKTPDSVKNCENECQQSTMLLYKTPKNANKVLLEKSTLIDR